MKKNLLKKMLIFLLFFVPIGLLAQNTITGTVTDTNSGEPLFGATVVVKGTEKGTTTDFDGKYSLTVNDLPVMLVFSSLGYDAKEVAVSSSVEPVNVSLTGGVALDEVVVTGLATSIKRTNSANAVSSISAQELVGVTPPQTLDAALYGKFTGAVVSANSGAPGGGLSIKLRGVTSVNGNSQPLYIIDGVYVDNSSIPSGLNAVSGAAAGGSASNQDNPSNRIADIDPNDIANIEILKGASAAAIYGSRASAGVVIITTKRGKAGETKFSFSQAFGFTQAINLQGIRDWDAAKVEDAYGAAEVPLFTAAQASGNYFDYEDELYGENGLISNTRFGMSGGGEKTKFYAGISYNDEDGIVQNTGYRKASVRLNLDHKVSNSIKFGLSANYINSSSNRGYFNNDNTGTTIGVSLTSTRPWDQLFPDANGNYPDSQSGASNVLQTRDLVTNNEKVNRFIIGGSADIKLYSNDNSNLKMILRAGLDSYNLSSRAIFPKELQFENVVGGDNGVSIQGSTVNRNLNFSGFLVHNYTTESDLNFRTQAGITKEVFDRNSYLIIAKDLIASENNVDQAGSIDAAQTRLKQEDAGFFVQEEINFQDKFIGTIGIRGDRSSNNGDAQKLYYYPKASLAVNINNFDFWKSEVINQVKLRIAYGESGNFAPFGSLFTSFNRNNISGFKGISVSPFRGNPNIEPERQKELELGFDLGFLDNRVELQFTWYNKKVDDLLLQAALPPSSGFTSKWTNAGNLENKGIEIAINAVPIRTNDFEWSTNISFWKNTSEITKLDVPAFNIGAFGATLGTFRIEEGKSATQIVGISPDGLVQHGDSEADFQMSFRNNVKYKNFELSFLWHWKKGGDNVNLTALLTDLNSTSHDFDDVDLDPAGQLGNGPYRLSQLGVSAAPFVEDASYLRLRELGLYYSIPKNLITKWSKEYIDSIKLGFSGTNLINIFDYNSYDPEVSNFGSNGISTGVEVTPFPSSKRYMFHLAIEF
jgi:TonB-linked SusC/RagA family outer membrane protein